jgi:hypothetical protein
MYLIGSAREVPQAQQVFGPQLRQDLGSVPKPQERILLGRAQANEARAEIRMQRWRPSSPRPRRV